VSEEDPKIHGSSIRLYEKLINALEQPRFSDGERAAMNTVLKMSELSGIVAAFHQKEIATIRDMLKGE